MKMFKVKDLFKAVGVGESLLPTGTDFDFWEDTYTTETAVYDREFARRFSLFDYCDFLDADQISDARENFHADVLSIITANQKKYAEIYRVFLIQDEDLPITYNYDMTETTGKQTNTFTKGSETDTIGQHQDTIGEITETHKVAPYNSSTFQNESEDITSSHTDTIGSHSDTSGQRIDTSINDEWTLTRRGNIGTQTGDDIVRIHLSTWSAFEFIGLIFNDICKQLLLIGD